MVRGRPREFDRDTALQAAMLIFWRKGFHAASMTDLCEAMAIASPSLYAAFGSKDGLYLEAVEHYWNTVQSVLWSHLEGSGSAQTCVENFLLEAANGLRKCGNSPGGCMVTAAILDEDMPAPLPKAVRNARRKGLDLVCMRLQAAVAAGELNSSTNVKHLGRFYISIIQGMATQARDGATRTELEGIAKCAMAAWPGSEVHSRAE